MTSHVLTRSARIECKTTNGYTIAAVPHYPGYILDDPPALRELALAMLREQAEWAGLELDIDTLTIEPMTATPL